MAGLTEGLTQFCDAAPFRVGIESLIAQDDMLGVGKLMIKDMMMGMHTGRIGEWVEAWVHEEGVVTTSKTMPCDLSSIGKEGWVRAYNDVFIKHYGCPETTLTFKLEGVVRTGRRTVRTDYVLEALSPTGVNNVEHLTFEDTYDEQYKHIESHGTARRSPFTSPTAVINPVPVKKLSPRDGIVQQAETTEDVAAAQCVPTPQIPSFTRPCLHNTWDSIRTKKGIALLRCRTCVARWKLPSSEAQRCKKFFEDPKQCRLGTLCPNLHVHAKRAEKMAAEYKAPGIPNEG